MTQPIKHSLELLDADTVLAGQPGRWRSVTSVFVREDLLTWTSSAPATAITAEGQGLLASFLNLPTEPSDAGARAAAARYAGRWGPLYLCAEHGLPSTHSLGGGSWSGSEPRECPVAREGDLFGESLSAWMDLSSSMRAVLLAGSEIHGPTEPAPKILRDLKAAVPRGIRSRQIEGAEKRRLIPLECLPETGRVGPIDFTGPLVREALVQISVDEWLGMAALRPGFNNSDAGFNLELEPRSLFGALALSLALALTMRTPVVACLYCGRITERRHHGIQCCRRKACEARRVAENSRNYRRRKAAAP